MTNEADEVQLSDQDVAGQDVAGQNFDDQSIDKPKLSAKYEHLTLEEQVAALSNDLGDALKEAEQNRDTAQRAQAEMVNYRKRADEERISLQQYSNSRLIIKLLPVLDELGLAIDHADQNESSNPWLEGVRLIQRKASNWTPMASIWDTPSDSSRFDAFR